MKAQDARPRAADPDTQRGTANALAQSYLPDRAADAAFESLIERLKLEPGTNRGNQ